MGSRSCLGVSVPTTSILTRNLCTPSFVQKWVKRSGEEEMFQLVGRYRVSGLPGHVLQAAFPGPISHPTHSFIQMAPFPMQVGKVN